MEELQIRMGKVWCCFQDDVCCSVLCLSSMLCLPYGPLPCLSVRCGPS